ncbi:MAG: substrate-binding domain-containing protein [Spirochaetales bacterium]|nr:substrate-binding domain-containing protein [Spirochaetales bacterium]
MLLKYRSNRRNIAVITDRFEHRYQFVLSTHLSRLSREQDINMIFFSGFSLKSPVIEEERFNMVYELVNLNLLDGIIISAGSLGHFAEKNDIIEFCNRFNSIPLVSIAMMIPGIPSILVDNKGGMKDAVVHLIEKHGKTKIGFIKGPDGHDEAESRFAGYLEALKSKGLPFDKSIVFRGTFNDVIDETQMIEAIQQNEVDALASANDMMAMEVVYKINELGKKVPEDIPIVSFDDLDISEHFDPPLTTVRQPLEEIAEEALSTVMMIIDKNQPPAIKTLPNHFIIRNSCGCNSYGKDDFSIQLSQGFAQLETKYKKLKNYFKTMDETILEWRYFSQEMNAVYEYEDITEKLAVHLKNIGIDQFYLCLYQNTVDFPDFFVPKYSTLFMAIDERGVVVNGKNSITFITEKLLPEGIVDETKQFIFSVQPLMRQKTHYGYIIFGVTDLEALVYGIVREQVTNSIQIIHAIKERNEMLEKIKRTLDSLKASEEKFREMVTNLPSIIIEMDVDTRILYMNKAGQKVFAFDEEILPENVLLKRYVHDSDRARFEEYRRMVLVSSEPRMIELRLVVQKHTVELICLAVPIVRNNEVQGIRLSAINLNPLLKTEVVIDDSIINSYHLSSREKEVLQHLIVGEKYKDIANKLFIAECTVKDHVKSIFFKMGVENKKDFFYKYSHLFNKTNKHESLVYSLLKFYINE